MMRFLVALVVGLFVVNAAQAADAAAVDAAREALRSSVAVVDMQLLMRESTAAKSIQEQIEKQHGKYQQQITAQENNLRDAEKELGRQRTVLEPEAYGQKRKEFERKIGDVQRDMQEKKRALETAYARGIDAVQRKVIEIVSKIAEERKLMMVLPNAQVILVENAMDITKDVLTKLNEELPAVKVDVREGEAADADKGGKGGKKN